MTGKPTATKRPAHDAPRAARRAAKGGKGVSAGSRSTAKKAGSPQARDGGKGGAGNSGGSTPQPVRKRREQQRAIETKRAILSAALSEFAQVGFEGASIRNIAAITGLQHPLITYHYRTKEILWQAVAEDAFAQIRQLWDERLAGHEEMSPIERLQAEYSTFLRFTMTYPDFHHFMLRESRPGNPRLTWLVQTIILPTMQRVLPDIERAQAEQLLPPGNPALVHYMLIGMTSVLSSLKEEIKKSVGVATDDPGIVDSYLEIVNAVAFRGAPRSD